MTKFQKVLIFSLAGIIIAFSANALAKKKKRKQVKKPVAVKPVTPPMQPNTASTLQLCSNDYQFPYWRLAIVRGFVFPANMQAPSQYRLVTINEKALQEYLKLIPFDKAVKKIQLPLYLNATLQCKEYKIERVWTMDSVLQAKYPDLMSFKATDPNNPLNTARIDCDGTSTKIMITENEEILFVQPVVFNKQQYYACYSKNDSNFQKAEFERKR